MKVQKEIWNDFNGEIFSKELTRQSGQEPLTLASTRCFFVDFPDFWLMQNFGAD